MSKRPGDSTQTTVPNLALSCSNLSYAAETLAIAIIVVTHHCYYCCCFVVVVVVAAACLARSLARSLGPSSHPSVGGSQLTSVTSPKQFLWVCMGVLGFNQSLSFLDGSDAFDHDPRRRRLCLST
ncbi:hypothetical protein CGRA01v4_06672 [Colletotrichum graminicola]|nr:hypothetical protein CGRA01v4_06672 [Colletotrichum graminicola]